MFQAAISADKLTIEQELRCFRTDDAEVVADLSGQVFLDFSMSGDCGGCAVDRIAIYGVLPAFTHKHASVRLDVPDEIGSFHHLRRTQDQLFACHFRTGSKSLLEMFTIGFKD